MISSERPCVRTALQMSVLVAVRYDRTLEDAYLALRVQGKPAQVALVAIAHRILITANAILKAKPPYSPKT